MESFNYSPEELESLLVRLTEFGLLPHEEKRLGDLLSSNEGARQFYVSYMTLHGELERRHAVSLGSAGPLAVPDANFPSPGLAPDNLHCPILPALGIDQGSGILNENRSLFSSHWFNQHFSGLLFAIGGLLVMVGVIAGGVAGWMLRGRDHISEIGSAAVHHNLSPVAYLTSANGCNWGGASPQLKLVGGSVQSGDEIVLHEGIAEFRLSSGVVLSVEGPAGLVMTSPTSLILQHGRVTTYVPWAVTDFRLTTPACRLTACDAEFGVHVAGGEVDIHAFSGEVTALPVFANDDGETVPSIIEREEELAADDDFAPVLVRVNRGLAIVNQGSRVRVSRWHPADESQFAIKLTMGGELPISKDYVTTVIASKPASYWRFESCEDELVPNEIQGGVGLKTIGPLRLVGDSKNRAAELGRPGSDCFLLSNGEMTLGDGKNYSVEFWIKPSHGHSGALVSFLADFAVDRIDRHAFYMQLLGSGSQESRLEYDNPNRIRFLHRDPPGSSSYVGTSCFSSQPYSLRRWQHVVATKEGNTMRLYVDGNLSSEMMDKGLLASRFHVLVGQIFTSRRLFPFVGQLDELALYNHALSKEAVREHFERVQWKSSSPSPSRVKEI